MSEYLRSIVTRLRARVADRRSAPRRILRLPCTVFIHDPRLDAAQTDRRAPRLEAFTRDLSRTGIGLVAPAVRIGERYLTDSPLRLVLEHPTGPLELTASPVRYEQLEDSAGERGYLIGLRITAMSDADRARYERHLEKPGARS
jgi:PilZ domain-containing protein